MKRPKDPSLGFIQFIRETKDDKFQMRHVK